MTHYQYKCPKGHQLTVYYPDEYVSSSQWTENKAWLEKNQGRNKHKCGHKFVDNKDVEMLIGIDIHLCKRPRNKDDSLDLENRLNKGVKFG